MAEPLLKRPLRACLRRIERSDAGFRLALRLIRGARGPRGRPEASWANSALRSRAQLDACLAQIRRLGLPPMRDAPKNWDALCALDLILRSTLPGARVLDAGAARWSMLLPWLSLYGYRNLEAVNLEFDAPFRRGPIRYTPGDITATTYPDAAFDAAACLSVIEHGVDADAFFREMARIIVPTGLLVISTDYSETPVDTCGASAFGAPVRILARGDAEALLAAAARRGWTPTSAPDLDCDEKVVLWEEFGLRFTFLVLAFRRSAADANRGMTRSPAA